jgi:hypothetical protein
VPIKTGKYVHFKGNEYEVINTATHSETQENLVVYRALYGDGKLWACPASMWSELVEHDGKLVKRFTHIDEITAKEYPIELQFPEVIHKRSDSSDKVKNGGKSSA